VIVQVASWCVLCRRKDSALKLLGAASFSMASRSIASMLEMDATPRMLIESQDAHDLVPIVKNVIHCTRHDAPEAARSTFGVFWN